MDNIGNRLRKIRIDRIESQKDMAIVLGIPFRTLQDCEQGKTLPSATTLAAFAAIGVNLNWVVVGGKIPDSLSTPKTEKVAADRVNSVENDFIPIPWFASNEICKSYFVDKETQYKTAKVAMHKSELLQMQHSKNTSSSERFQLASTTVKRGRKGQPGMPCGIIIFDLSDTEPTEPGYYVCVTNDSLVVKHFQLLSNGSLISINNGVSRAAALESKSTRIIGKVLENF